MVLANLLFVAIGTATAWWMSGYDTRVTDENPRSDFMRRAIRCGITTALLATATINGVAAIMISVILGIIWASCGAEFFSQQFHKLMDPEDKRKFDPEQINRDLDQLGRLEREGKSDEAFALCRKLEASGEASPIAIETTLFHLYQQAVDNTSPQSGIQRLREQRRFLEAESWLKQALASEPGNWVSRLLLMRIYAEDLSERGKALALLEPADKQPPLHPAFIKFARRSIDEWSNPAAKKEKAGDGIESLLVRGAVLPGPQGAVDAELPVDDLLAGGQLTTAIEDLEKKAAMEPGNFDIWLKLAEVYAVNCADLNRAGKIIRKILISPAFTPEQVQQANTKLKEWRNRSG